MKTFRCLCSTLAFGSIAAIAIGNGGEAPAPPADSCWILESKNVCDAAEINTNGSSGCLVNGVYTPNTKWGISTDVVSRKKLAAEGQPGRAGFELDPTAILKYCLYRKATGVDAFGVCTWTETIYSSNGMSDERLLGGTCNGGSQPM